MRASERTTRGKTRSGRLRHLDAWLTACEADLLARRDGPWEDALVVDVGVGHAPTTTVELAAAVAPVRVVGVERDADYIANARAAAPGLEVRGGGFDLPLDADERARLVRAVNLLRAYPAAQAADARKRMGASLRVGGLLVEGSTDRTGDVGACGLWRRTEHGLVGEALWMHVDTARGFHPEMIRGVLPRDLRGPPPHPVFRALLQQWTQAWSAVRARGVTDPQALLEGSVARVPDLDGARAAHGDVVWRPEGGLP